jgi:AcrR family transcriptional regulator
MARRARNSITASEILDAAERVARDGADALTLRAVGDELAASAMSLYRYFPTKEALIMALLDQVLGRFEPPTPTDDWAADLEQFALAHREVLVNHAWAVTSLFTHPEPGPNAMRIGEFALQILARGGIHGEQAVVTFGAMIALNYGWAGFATATDPAPVGEIPPEVAAAFPLTLAAAAAWTQYASDDYYRRGLGMLLAGIPLTATAE